MAVMKTAKSYIKSVFQPYETHSFVKRNKDHWFNITQKPVQDNKHNIYDNTS